MDIVWIISIILFIVGAIAFLRVIQLEREVRGLKEGRQFFGDKCYSCVKHNGANCPRCTLYLTECEYYYSPTQQAEDAASDPYEK